MSWPESRGSKNAAAPSHNSRKVGISDSSKAQPALAASSTESPNGSYRAGLTKMEALSISPSSAACDISPTNSQLVKAVEAVLLSNSDAPAILIGHATEGAAEATADKFLALSHSRPALRTNGRLPTDGPRPLSTPFQITCPPWHSPYCQSNCSRKARLGATHTSAFRNPAST